MAEAGAVDECSVGFTPRLVVAIDFGTYASGYALQLRSDYDKERLKIHANTKWESGGFCTYKTPTCLLLKPNLDIAEFGYKAEQKYCNLKEEQPDGENWYFFRNFKMALHRQDGNIDKNVEGADGKLLDAETVFSKAIEYMKNHALEHLTENGIPYPKQETKWVITVPAIWSDQAKTMMRKAAKRAGIDGRYLTIALEPECAAIYCSQLSRQQLEIEGDNGKLKYIAAPGSVVMIVDMGGGTVDITTVQIESNSKMKHIYQSGGGAWGGMKVDERFMVLIKDIVGETVLKEFDEENQLEMYDFRNDFECAKRELKHPSQNDADARFRVRLPGELKAIWLRNNRSATVGEILQSSPRLREIGVKFGNGRLSFPSNLIEGFFEETIKDIINYLDKAIKSPAMRQLPIDAMIVVGGFAMSHYVIHSLREGLRSRGIPVVRPESSELAVLNGAVLFGHDEKVIGSRIMQHTYGVAFTMKYDALKHEAESKYELEGKVWANNVFRKHVTIGQEVKLGEWISDKEYNPDDDQQTKATVYVFTSDQENPRHTTDTCCKCIGHFGVEFPPFIRGQKRSVEIAMNFGGTEVKVRGIEKVTGKTFIKHLQLP